MSGTNGGVGAVLVLLATVLAVAGAPTAAAVGPTVGEHELDPTGPETAPITTNDSTGVEVTRVGGYVYRIVIGDDDPRMVVRLDLSLFGNLPGPGTIGFQSYGQLDGVRLVTIDVAVIFEGVGDPAAFVRNPFSRFRIESRSAFRLPFLHGPGADVTEGSR